MIIFFLIADVTGNIMPQLWQGTTCHIRQHSWIASHYQWCMAFELTVSLTVIRTSSQSCSFPEAARLSQFVYECNACNSNPYLRKIRSHKNFRVGCAPSTFSWCSSGSHMNILLIDCSVPLVVIPCEPVQFPSPLPCYLRPLTWISPILPRSPRSVYWVMIRCGGSHVTMLAGGPWGIPSVLVWTSGKPTVGCLSRLTQLTQSRGLRRMPHNALFDIFEVMSAYLTFLYSIPAGSLSMFITLVWCHKVKNWQSCYITFSWKP